MAALPLVASQRQRRGAKTVRSLYVCAGADQFLGHRDIVPTSRPVESRRAVGLRGVRVCMQLQQ